MLRDKSMSLKLENIIVSTIYLAIKGMARHREVPCVFRLQRLPVADLGRRKVPSTVLWVFGRRFRVAEPGPTMMESRYRRWQKPCWRVWEGCFGVCI